MTINTLSTLHSTLHSPLPTPHSPPLTPHSSLFTPHSQLPTPNSPLPTPHSHSPLPTPLLTPHSSLCSWAVVPLKRMWGVMLVEEEKKERSRGGRPVVMLLCVMRLLRLRVFMRAPSLPSSFRVASLTSFPTHAWVLIILPSLHVYTFNMYLLLHLSLSFHEGYQLSILTLSCNHHWRKYLVSTAHLSPLSFLKNIHIYTMQVSGYDSEYIIRMAIASNRLLALLNFAEVLMVCYIYSHFYIFHNFKNDIQWNHITLKCIYIYIYSSIITCTYFLSILLAFNNVTCCVQTSPPVHWVQLLLLVCSYTHL